ncbi:peroxisome biogenesis protein 7-like [Magnolia sinica]|uniref:peroxisome biogenesis protein 7-like n=1 Tax=Magnolia sinica TaxID=86752 RepID=UPI002659C9E8|nr:peroxisome biogenesis protein 7-like [Magnolia sinica]
MFLHRPIPSLLDCKWSSTNPNHIIVETNEGGSCLIDLNQDDNNPRKSFLTNNDSHTLSVDWHTNGESFLSAYSDGIVNQWFIDQPNPKYTFRHPTLVTCVTWNPQDPNCYASTCHDGNLCIRDIRNGNDGITIKADDSRLLSCDWNWHGKSCIAIATSDRNHIKV